MTEFSHLTSRPSAAGVATGNSEQGFLSSFLWQGPRYQRALTNRIRKQWCHVHTKVLLSAELSFFIWSPYGHDLALRTWPLKPSNKLLPHVPTKSHQSHGYHNIKKCEQKLKHFEIFMVYYIPVSRWVDNIRMYLQEVGCGNVDWIGLAQDRQVAYACECGNEPSVP